MKSNYIIIFLCAFAAVFCSCTHPCTTPTITAININGGTADYEAKITSYKRGNNFTSVVDSSTIPVSNNKFGFAFQRDYDYRIVTQPGKKVHELLYIGFGNEKTSGSQGKESDECTTSMQYKIDDSLIIRPSMNNWVGGGPQVTISVFE